MPDDEFLSLTDELLAFLKREVKPCLGLHYLIILMQCVNQIIHCTQLRYLELSASEDAWEFDNPDYVVTEAYYCAYTGFELPIEACDLKTLIAVRKRAKHALFEYHAAKAIRNLPEIERLQKEMSQLDDYLRYVKDGKNDIRNLEDKTHTDAVTIRAALNVLIANVREINPHYADLIETHLETGTRLRWKDGWYAAN